MEHKRWVQFSILLALFQVTAHSVFAFDPPPPPQGLPWGLPTVMPWPTARPLAVGESWSPAQNIPPAPLMVIPTITSTPAPIRVTPAVKSFSLSPGSPTPGLSKSIPAPAAPQPPVIYVTPLPKTMPEPITLPSVPVGAGGSNPMDALMPSGDWLRLEAGAVVWYRVGTNGAQMSVYLDLNPASNVTMAIYAPGQLDRPIGKGTPNGQDGTRLIWSGGHWSAQGDWYAQVINYNPMAVQYRLTSHARDNSNKMCHSYWEEIKGAPVFWTVCE